jgi:hypothetical protein
MENKISENTVRTCLECGLPLGPGREDRKYCNDVCRTAYNNRRRKVAHDSIKPAGPEVKLNPDREMAAIRRVQDILLENRVRLYNMYELFEHIINLNDF